jgi:uncharacterized protein YneF (UPF0154 family)
MAKVSRHPRVARKQIEVIRAARGHGGAEKFVRHIKRSLAGLCFLLSGVALGVLLAQSILRCGEEE